MDLQFIQVINNFTENPIYTFIFWSTCIIAFVISFGLQLFDDKLCNLLGEIVRVIHHFSVFLIYFGWSAPQSILIYMLLFNILALLSWTFTKNKCILTVIENKICHFPKSRRFRDLIYYFPWFHLEKFNIKYRIYMIGLSFSFILLRLYATPSSMHLPFIQNDTPMQIQAHRGGALECRCPDNTIRSFDYALKINVDVLEMDINITKDKYLVVYHDRYINNVLCKDLTLDQVRKLAPLQSEDINTAGSSPSSPDHEKIPTLVELLDYINASNYANKNTIGFNIEIKTSSEIDNVDEVNEFAKLLIDTINKYDIKKRTTIQSFDKRAIQAVQLLDPAIELSFLVEDPNVNVVNIGKELKVSIISPNYKLIDAKIVDKLHQNGLKILPWTVDEIIDVQHMLDMKVDGIITGYPKKMMEYVGKRRR